LPFPAVSSLPPLLDRQILLVLGADNGIAIVVIAPCVVHGRSSFHLSISPGYYSRQEVLSFMLADRDDPEAPTRVQNIRSHITIPRIA